MAGLWHSVSKHLVSGSYYIVIAVTTGRNRKSAQTKRIGMKTVLGGVCAFTTKWEGQYAGLGQTGYSRGLAEREGSLPQQ